MRYRWVVNIFSAFLFRPLQRLGIFWPKAQGQLGRVTFCACLCQALACLRPPILLHDMCFAALAENFSTFPPHSVCGASCPTSRDWPFTIPTWRRGEILQLFLCRISEEPLVAASTNDVVLLQAERVI